MRDALKPALIAVLVFTGCGQSSRIGETQPAAVVQPACAPGTPAVAHDAAGNILSFAAVPIACATLTGFGGAETHIRVASNGTVVEQPAVIVPGILGTGFVPGAPGPHPETQLSVAGLAVSHDAGKQWQFVKPGGATWVGQDSSIYIDRASDRLFFYALAVNPAPQGGGVPLTDQVPSYQAHLLSSGDDGVTWNVVGIPGFNNSENPRFTSAPAAAGQPAAIAGENVTYWCGNNMQFTFVARICYRSMDGGVSWQQTSIMLTRGVPRHSECGNSEEDLATYDGHYPVGAADGSLWLLLSCGGKTFLARSTDGSVTWPILRKAGSSEPLTIPAAEELRIDPVGNLYSVRQQGSALNLRISRDGGQSWSDPLNMTAPAVRKAGAFQWATASRGPGQVAVTYLVPRSGGGYDGYITVTRNALDAQPVFFSAAFNSADAPLVTRSQTAKDDYIDVDLGPDGTPWAAFYSDCPADNSEPTCAAAGGVNPLGAATTVGWFQWPR